MITQTDPTVPRLWGNPLGNISVFKANVKMVKLSSALRKNKFKFVRKIIDMLKTIQFDTLEFKQITYYRVQ